MEANAFYLQVAQALSGCQLVEQELKLYIAEALELVQKSVAGKLPFSMSGEDYAGESLGTLVRVFQKLSSNPALVAELHKFTAKRNILSHTGIAHCIDPNGELDYGSASEFQSELSAIQQQAERLLSLIHEEANKFRPHLDFDGISEVD